MTESPRVDVVLSVDPGRFAETIRAAPAAPPPPYPRACPGAVVPGRHVGPQPPGEHARWARARAERERETQVAYAQG
ncbi:hypothetical protein, partial [Streptomyces tricolor]